MPAPTPMTARTILPRHMPTHLFPSLAALVLAIGLSGCGPSYSPNSYASNAAQLANKVDQGVVIGVRPVLINADTTLGTGTGAAAGGIAGSTLGGGSVGALGALGGSVTGGIVGNVVSHTAGDTDGFEYIVRKTNGDKTNGDLMSVTQKDAAPLGIGAHVLIIEGPQARIVADYTVPVVSEPLHVDAGKDPVKPDAGKPDTPKSALADIGAKAGEVAGAAPVVATPLPPPASAVPVAAASSADAPKPAPPVDSAAAKPGDATAAKPSGS
jgi:outer membrane lipoprotein SlyB